MNFQLLNSGSNHREILVHTERDHDLASQLMHAHNTWDTDKLGHYSKYKKILHGKLHSITNSVLASHPAAPGSIPDNPKVFFQDFRKIVLMKTVDVIEVF